MERVVVKKFLEIDEEKIKEALPTSSVTIEPIFVSDEETDGEKTEQEENDISSSPRESLSKRIKFNTEEFIAEIDKESKIKAMKQVKKQVSQSEAT